ncbi:hypothetical protein L9F63_024484, partial [Diploptera punctata]
NSIDLMGTLLPISTIATQFYGSNIFITATKSNSNGHTRNRNSDRILVLLDIYACQVCGMLQIAGVSTVQHSCVYVLKISYVHRFTSDLIVYSSFYRIRHCKVGA